MFPSAEQDDARVTKSGQQGGGELDLTHLPSVVFNMINSTVGVGILGLAFGMANLGWAGIPIIILTGLSQIYTGLVILDCLKYRPDCNSLPDLVGALTSWPWKIFARLAQEISNLGTVIVYILFVGDTMTKMTGWGSPAVWATLGTTAIMPAVLVRNLTETTLLAFLSAVAVTLLFFVVTILAVQDPNTAPEEHLSSEVSFTSVARGLSTFYFAFGYGTVLVPIIRAIPTNRTRVGELGIAISQPAAIIMFVIVCGVGFHAYGCESPSDILTRLPLGVLWMVGSVAITVHVLTAIPVFTNDFFFSLEEEYMFKRKAIAEEDCDRYEALPADEGAEPQAPEAAPEHGALAPLTNTERAQSFGLRIAGMGLFLLIAVFVSSFGIFLSLTGASMIVLTVSLPCMMHLRLYSTLSSADGQEHLTLPFWSKALDWTLLVGGFFFAAVATISAIYDLAYPIDSKFPLCP